MSLLTVHLYVAFLVALLAVFAVWRRPERRITLYVVTLQILIGIVLMIEGLRVPGIHPALAVVGWAGYMVANAFARRPERRTLGLVIAGVSSLLILVAYYIGMEAVKHG
jgi:CHASE2 domain-containing sensor protein